MKIELQPRDDNQVQLIAEIDSETLEKYMIRASRQISKQSKIAGFRPGKAPFEVVKRMYGEEAIQREAIELMMDDVYPEALKQAEIEPSGPGQLEEIQNINPPKFSFIVPLKPVVDLGEYRSIREDYTPVVVEEKDVEDVIKSLQNNFATAEPSTNPSQDGDLIYGTLSGELTEVEEGESTDLIRETPYQVVIGDTSPDGDAWPYAGFSANLVGLSDGEEKTIEYTYSDESPYEKLRGKSARFTVKIQSVKKRTLPELNDEFAKTIGEFETLEDLRKNIRERLEQTKTAEYNREFVNKVVDRMVEGATLKYAPHMLADEVEHSLEHIQEDLKQQNLDLETYLKIRNIEREKFISEEVSPAAKRRLERGLVLDKVAELEKVEVSKEDLQKAVLQNLMGLQQDPEFAKVRGRKKFEELANVVTYQTANQMLNDRVLDRVKAIATGNADVVAEEVTEPVETPDASQPSESAE